MFDAMGALSTKYNDTPERASRPYDRNRDGFVVANGGGLVVLEEYERAKKRGATIYGEVVGYGATADGADMVQPTGEGAARCIRLALETAGNNVDYINAHGTSTPIGDLVELRTIREVFGEHNPPISSTKSLSGHSLGAAGVHEAIYSLLMMQNGFIAASANITQLDPEIRAEEIAQKRVDNVDFDSILSNSFGFGGTNATLLLSKYRE